MAYVTFTALELISVTLKQNC